MFSVTANGDHVSPNKVEITADLLSDIENIPTTFDVGSTCIVLQDTSVWMLGNDKIWHQI